MSGIGLRDVISNPAMLVDGVDLLLGTIQSGLESEFASRTLPLIGDSLSGGTQFVADLRADFIAPLREGLRATFNAGGSDACLAPAEAYRWASENGLRLPAALCSSHLAYVPRSELGP